MGDEGVNTEIQEPMHSSDSLKSDSTKLKTIVTREHTEKDHEYGMGDTTYIRICIYLKNETTKNLISSSLFWHIMNFKSDIQNFKYHISNLHLGPHKQLEDYPGTQ